MKWQDIEIKLTQLRGSGFEPESRRPTLQFRHLLIELL